MDKKISFLEHIFSGSLLIYTLVFHFIFGAYFYFFFFQPESFYGATMAYVGAALCVVFYTMYWYMCITSYRDLDNQK